MTVICTYTAEGLRTPHDGTYHGCGGIEVEVCATSDGRLYARTAATGDLAYLHSEMHRLWSLNPGLREALLDRVRCATLVRG